MTMTMGPLFLPIEVETTQSCCAQFWTAFLPPAEWLPLHAIPWLVVPTDLACPSNCDRPQTKLSPLLREKTNMQLWKKGHSTHQTDRMGRGEGRADFCMHQKPEP